MCSCFPLFTGGLLFSLRAFVYRFCFSLVATVRCGQVNNGRGWNLQRPPASPRGAMRARLSRETGCGGLVFTAEWPIVLKHDSAFNSYCSRSSHLALVGERSASGGGKWILLSPVHQFSGIYMPPCHFTSLATFSDLHIFLQAVVISSQTTNFSRAHISHQKIWCQLNFPPSQSLVSRSLIRGGDVERGVVE